MVPFSIIPLRQQEEEVDRPHLQLVNSHAFIQPRQICRSVQDGTDKHVFYIPRYTILCKKIQAFLSPDIFSAFQGDAKTTPARSCRTTPNIAGIERLHDHLRRIRASHPFTPYEHLLSSSFSGYVLSSETTSRRNAVNLHEKHGNMSRKNSATFYHFFPFESGTFVLVRNGNVAATVIESFS
jgi:hypothetical protein